MFVYFCPKVTTEYTNEVRNFYFAHNSIHRLENNSTFSPSYFYEVIQKLKTKKSLESRWLVREIYKPHTYEIWMIEDYFANPEDSDHMKIPPLVFSPKWTSDKTKELITDDEINQKFIVIEILNATSMLVWNKKHRHVDILQPSRVIK